MALWQITLYVLLGIVIFVILVIALFEYGFQKGMESGFVLGKHAASQEALFRSKS